MAIWGSFKKCIIGIGKEMRSKGKYEVYRKLNAAFQKKERQDKEQRIVDKCKQIEDNNKMGKTRNLFKEIK